VTHTPSQQVWVTSHTLPQAPQLRESSRELQRPLQHVSPAAQALPHRPQFSALVLVLMQALLQQDMELGQAEPQAPQLALLMRVSTQVPLQQV